MEALGALGLALLAVHAGALAVLAFTIGRDRVWRGLLALAFPPLAAVWGWDRGAKRAVMAWGGTLALFVADVIAIRFLR
jgi:hypothetical protein